MASKLTHEEHQRIVRKHARSRARQDVFEITVVAVVTGLFYGVVFAVALGVLYLFTKLIQ